MRFTKFSPTKGFTLLEILLVVAAIAILAGIVIFAINPGKQLAEARNARRKADVNTIINALYQHKIDTGLFPNALPISDQADCTNPGYEICTTDGGYCTTIDLSELTNSQTYLVSMPIDPSGGGYEGGTGYHALQNSNQRATVCAPQAENGITITRSL